MEKDTQTLKKEEEREEGRGGILRILRHQHHELPGLKCRG